VSCIFNRGGNFLFYMLSKKGGYYLRIDRGARRSLGTRDRKDDLVGPKRRKGNHLVAV